LNKHWLSALLVIAGLASVGATTTAQAKTDYYTKNPGIIRVKKTVAYYKNAAKTKHLATVH